MHVLDLPANLGLNATFNVEDLTLYKAHDQDSLSKEHEIQLPPSPAPADKIVDVLNDQIVSTRQRGFQKFLVRWKNRSIFDATWITATDF